MFTPPQHVERVEDCLFYHSIDLPGLGTIVGQWDLRPTVDAYLGHVDFRNKRVLDVGTASGYLSFEIERLGAAEVVSLDMTDAREWELVPYSDSRYDIGKMRQLFADAMPRIESAYWLSHRLLGSRAKLIRASLHDLPAELGTFDVVVLGMLLPHVSDPFRALWSVSRLVHKTLVITQQELKIDGAFAYFMPDPATQQPPDAWWSLSAGAVVRMLDILGFDVKTTEECAHFCPVRGESEACTTYVAVRRHHANDPAPLSEQHGRIDRPELARGGGEVVANQSIDRWPCAAVDRKSPGRNLDRDRGLAATVAAFG